MKNCSHKKNWNLVTVQVHMGPPPFPLIKSKNNDKLNEDCVKINLSRDMTSQKSDLYEFKMALFDNSEPEEFLLFISNFNMNLDASGTLVDVEKLQYLSMLVHVEALHQFDTLSAKVGSNIPENLMSTILCLGT